jgi:soluble P-type ATPase
MKTAKPGIKIGIPGHGEMHLRRIVSDYTGTLSYRGKLVDGVDERLRALGGLLEIDILSADTRGTAKDQLSALPINLHILSGANHDVQKRDFAARFDLRQVAAFGNGANDRLLLKAVKQAGGLAVAVENGEGCAIDALMNAHIFIMGAANTLDLLIDTKFVTATLRF